MSKHHQLKVSPVFSPASRRLNFQSFPQKILALQHPFSTTIQSTSLSPPPISPPPSTTAYLPSLSSRPRPLGLIEYILNTVPSISPSNPERRKRGSHRSFPKPSSELTNPISSTDPYISLGIETVEMQYYGVLRGVDGVETFMQGLIDVTKYGEGRETFM